MITFENVTIYHDYFKIILTRIIKIMIMIIITNFIHENYNNDENENEHDDKEFI